MKDRIQEPVSGYFVKRITDKSQTENDIEESLDLKTGLESLKPKYREVLILKYMWGMTWHEVSKKLGIFKILNSIESLFIII